MNSAAQNENAKKVQKRQQRRDITNEISETVPATETDMHAHSGHSERSSILDHPAHSKKRKTPWHRFRTRPCKEKSENSDESADLNDESSDSDQETGAPPWRPKNKVARFSYSECPRILSHPTYSMKPRWMGFQSSKSRRAGQGERAKIGSSECPQSQKRPSSLPPQPQFSAKHQHEKANTPRDELELRRRSDVAPPVRKTKRARSIGENSPRSTEWTTDSETPQSSHRPSLIEFCVQKSIDMCGQFVDTPTARSNGHAHKRQAVSCGEDLQRPKSSLPLSANVEPNNDDPLCEEIILDGSHMHPPACANKRTVDGRRSPDKMSKTRNKRPRSKPAPILIINLDTDSDDNEVLENASSSDERQQEPSLTTRPSVTFADNPSKEVCCAGLQSQPSCSENLGNEAKAANIDQTNIEDSSVVLEVGCGSSNKNDKCEPNGKTIQLLDIDTFSEGDLDDEMRAMIEEFNRSDDEVRPSIEPRHEQNCKQPSPKRVPISPARETEEKGEIKLLDDVEVRKTDRRDSNASRSKHARGSRSKTSSAVAVRKRRKAPEAVSKKRAKVRRAGGASFTHQELPTKGSRVEILWEDRDKVFSGRLGNPLEKKAWTFEVYYDDGHIIIEKLNDVHWRYEPTEVEVNVRNQDIDPRRLNEGGWFEPGDLYQYGSENSDSDSDSSIEP